MNATLLNIDVDLIDPNPEQPRVHFDPDALQELGQSIVAHGLEQAITVEQMDNGRFLLRDGERRLRAHKLMGMPTIPALVKLPPGKKIQKRERLIGAFVANFQRQPLNPVEEAKALQKMHSDLGMSYQEIGAKLGMSKSAVANKVRLLRLPGEWLESVISGQVSERQAAAFLPATTLPPEMQEKIDKSLTLLWYEVVNEGLSSQAVRRELERIVERASMDIDRAVFAEMTFNDALINQPSCNGCPLIENDRCISPGCFARKTALYRDHVVAACQERWQLPVLPLGVNAWDLGNFYALRTADIPWILENRCDHLAAYIDFYWHKPNMLLADDLPGVYLVCSSRRSRCENKMIVARAGGETATPEPPTPKRQPSSLTMNMDKYGLELRRDSDTVYLTAAELLELIELFCAKRGIDPGVLHAKPQPDTPRDLVEECITFALNYTDEFGRGWADIENPSHTNGTFWQQCRTRMITFEVPFTDPELKTAIKTACERLKSG